MPELPEVETTVQGLKEYTTGLMISDVWTDYNSPFHVGKNNIKNPKYFKKFKESILQEKVIGASRRGKNVLIHLRNKKTILLHMKMTGHIMYGEYKKSKEWEPVSKTGPLRDPFNKFIHLVFTFTNKKHLVFSDMRKFGKIALFDTKEIENLEEIKRLGPEPLDSAFNFSLFKKALLKKSRGKIKQVLMDQAVIAGIGNIYSDEILWKSDVHPASIVSKIPEVNLKKMFFSMKEILMKGIDFGGDSMSDYRNIKGERGRFQHTHNAYRLTGKACKKKNCKGKIERMKIGGRSAHFCNVHQVKYL